MERVFITGISSDIGKELAKRYLKDGAVVSGTYRKNIEKELVEAIIKSGGILIHCDYTKKEEIEEAIERSKSARLIWDTFIATVGTLEPIGNFFELSYDQWEESINTNCMSQLRILHGMFCMRNKKINSQIIFFAGGGTNGAFSNYSAYCVSKIMLIKMCELIDAENSDVNIYIIGPGMIKTKIHQQTLDNRNEAGINYNKTISFLKSNYTYDEDMNKVYKFIQWGHAQGRNICGGRNFSVVYDNWNPGENLSKNLLKDKDMYKLRRYRNEEKCK